MTQSFPEELKDGKIGRVPVWAIGVGLAGAFVAFMYIRNRRNATATPDGGGPDQAAFDSSVDTSGLPDAVSNLSPLDPAFPVGLNANGVPAPLTNVQWSRLAFDYLIGQGNDPSLVETALAKYIGGQGLTAAERSIVNLAQQAFGAPPEGLIIADVVTPAPPAQTPTPPAPAPSTTAPSTNPYINANGTISVGANQNLYLVSDSAGLSGPDGHARFAALNPGIWVSNTHWGVVNGGLTPFSIRGMPYKIR